MSDPYLAIYVVVVCVQRQLLCFTVLALDHCCLCVPAPLLIFEVYIYPARWALHKAKDVFLRSCYDSRQHRVSRIAGSLKVLASCCIHQAFTQLPPESHPPSERQPVVRYDCGLRFEVIPISR
jgi:hypothetical protein